MVPTLSEMYQTTQSCINKYDEEHFSAELIKQNKEELQNKLKDFLNEIGCITRQDKQAYGHKRKNLTKINEIISEYMESSKGLSLLGVDIKQLPNKRNYIVYGLFATILDEGIFTEEIESFNPEEICNNSTEKGVLTVGRFPPELQDSYTPSYRVVAVRLKTSELTSAERVQNVEAAVQYIQENFGEK